ncbi:ABC transporter permease [Cuneatibacter caecimuris]|uniref:Putative ABC transport system permease protein n=1 Tax=Cuneatibacter caecimuris TaxID=1796618 RepID=A0A4Q7PKF5_9FIRM|nr:ABC transporter permease [Cuneatibacter caecimuris]RZT00549.1 putative ABC transport system permease protein [Cuneatibacter caecimuris]
MIQSFKMALKSIAGNKFRAFLTMLGIIIGVMALVILVSLVSGATGSVTDSISSLGNNLLSVTISDDKGAPVKLQTLNEWMEKDGIGLIAPSGETSVTGRYEGNSSSVTVYGTTPAYETVNGLSLLLGRFIKSSDVDSHTNVAVINETAATELIGYTDCIGEEVSLDGVKFTVVGLLEDDENSLTAVFGSGSMVAYIPYTSLMRLSSEVSSDITSFSVSAETDMAAAETAMTSLLMERFDQDDDAFTVSSQDVLEDAMSSVTSVLMILLGSIAGISLIVGGIGIMNIMLVTVTERTREIGIRKAIGAGRKVILQQFLLESVVLCMFGCAIGVFLSWAVLRILSVVVSSLSMSFSLEWNVVLIAVGFCFMIGIMFGLYPANKAAKMAPIDALHYGG